MDRLDAFAQAKLADLEARTLRRTIKTTRRLDGVWVERDGRRLLSFSCNDYLNLTHHPKVKAAAIAAIEARGTGSGASRLVTGSSEDVENLEMALARFKGTEAACVFSTGYAANTGIIPTLTGPGDLVLADDLAHASLWAGARLSGAEVAAFRHNDVEHLDEILTARRSGAGHVLIVTEGVFSMDGDVAPLSALSALAQRHNAWLMTDDAHGVGVLAEGRGSAAHFPDARIDLQMGTLSKGLASLGGYVCASQAVIDLIKTRARTLVYSTGLPPASAAAARAALEIIEADPGFGATPLAKARRFTRAANLPEATSAIVPVILGSAEAALAAQQLLETEGFLVVAIRPPTVAEGAARLRLVFTAGHADEDIDRLAASVRRLAA
jgi:8-amino-7-oxononanoate synthase